MRTATTSLIVALVATMFGCTPSTDRQASTIVFESPSRPLDEVECGTLLTDEEVEAALSGKVNPLGMSASSCYWFVGDELVQLVVQTGRDISGWKTLILEEHRIEIVGHGAEIWASAEDESVAAFGPDRGLLIHGVRDREAAIELLKLALARL